MEMPELFKEEYSCNSVNAQFNLEKQHADINKNNSIDQFIIDDLLDFSNEDPILDDDNNVSTNFGCFTGNSSLDSSIVTLVDNNNNNSTSNSSISGSHDQNFSTDFDRDFPIASFSDDLCVPYDDLAELEWVSNFVEESFSTEDLQKLQLISGIQTRTNEVSETGEEFQPESNGNNPTLDPELAVPGKARSKRPRAALNNWSSSRVLSPTTSSSGSDVGSVGSDSSGKKTIRVVMKKKEVFDVSPTRSGGGDVRDGRKCLHCATDKTPQWRTGPMGPKTLCNACGVRYKSGRLVPEYRPASSPTYVVTKHSNSHRKVIELRRQKEMQRSQYQQFLYPNPAFDESKCDDYLIHRHTESDFRQLI